MSSLSDHYRASSLGVAVAFLGIAACGARDTLSSDLEDAAIDSAVDEPSLEGDVVDAPLDTGLDAEDADSGPPDDGGTDGDASSDACANCVCAPGENTDCYSGPSSTAGVGVCASGKSTCTLLGQWGECIGQVLPTKEDCGTPFDEDCDGAVNQADAGCVCTPGATKECYGGPPSTLGIGACKAGIQACSATGDGWGVCAGQVVPTMEDCPSLDDEDCDGLVNEDGLNCVCKPGQTTQCYTGPPETSYVGKCYPGFATCAADGMSFGPCIGQTLPAQEDCDDSNFDEDCDGKKNEDGPSCVCVPDQYGGPCYTGPAGTSGVGACKPGKLLCKPSGLGYFDSCYDEVLPLTENCAAPADEDCDGTTAAPCAQPVWAKVLPANLRAVVDTLGTGVWLAGSSVQPTDFGGGVLPSGAGSDSWVVRLDSDGKHVWSRRFPGAGSDLVFGLSVGPGGESVVVGWCEGNAVFDSFSFDCTSSGKAYAVKLSASGAVAWAKVYGSDAGSHTTTGVDIDASGNIVLVGKHSTSIDFGGGPLPGSVGGATFLAKLDPDGNHVFSKSFAYQTSYSSATSAGPVDVATTSTGDIVMGGTFFGGFDLGGGSLGSGWGYKAYVGSFDAQGTHGWSKAWQSALGSRMRVSSAGTVFFTGSSLFVKEFTAGGAQLSSTSVPASGSTEIQALAVRPGLPVIIGGSSFYADFGFGKGPAPGGFLIGLDYSGKVLWQYPELKAVESAAYDSLGYLYAVGVDYLWKLSP